MDKREFFIILAAIALGITALVFWFQKENTEIILEQYQTYYEDSENLLHCEKACHDNRGSYNNEVDWYQSSFYLNLRNAQNKFEQTRQETKEYYIY